MTSYQIFRGVYTYENIFLANVPERLKVFSGHSGDLSEAIMTKPDQKPKCRPVLSLRAHEDMVRDIQAEAKKRKLRVSEELRPTAGILRKPQAGV